MSRASRYSHTSAQFISRKPCSRSAVATYRKVRHVHFGDSQTACRDRHRLRNHALVCAPQGQGRPQLGLGGQEMIFSTVPCRSGSSGRPNIWRYALTASAAVRSSPREPRRPLRRPDGATSAASSSKHRVVRSPSPKNCSANEIKRLSIRPRSQRTCPKTGYIAWPDIT